MSRPNENRPAGRETGKATNLNALTRTYSANDHASSLHQDKMGNLLRGDVIIGKVGQEPGGDAPPAVLRIREIEKLIDFRLSQYGLIPDYVEAQEAAFCFNWLAGGDQARLMANLSDWCWQWIPSAMQSHGNLKADYWEPIRIRLEGRIHISSADDCGAALELTAEEREKLSIRTIGAIGTTKATRAAARAEKKREYAKMRRRQEGSVPRTEFERSATRREIENLGISKSTYYRWMKQIKHQWDRSVPNREALLPTPVDTDLSQTKLQGIK